MKLATRKKFVLGKDSVSTVLREVCKKKKKKKLL